MLPEEEAIRGSCTRWEQRSSPRDQREQDRQEQDRGQEGQALLRDRGPVPRGRGRQALLRVREDREPDRVRERQEPLRDRDLREAARGRELQELARIRELSRDRARGAWERVRVRDLRGQLLRDLQVPLRAVRQRDRDREGEALHRDPWGMGDLSSLPRRFSRRISWKRMMNSNLNF